MIVVYSRCKLIFRVKRGDKGLESLQYWHRISQILDHSVKWLMIALAAGMYAYTHYKDSQLCL